MPRSSIKNAILTATVEGKEIKVEIDRNEKFWFEIQNAMERGLSFSECVLQLMCFGSEAVTERMDECKTGLHERFAPHNLFTN